MITCYTSGGLARNERKEYNSFEALPAGDPLDSMEGWLTFVPRANNEISGERFEVKIPRIFFSLPLTI